MRGLVITRAVVAVVAVLACAWFVLGARQAHDVNVVQSLLSASGTLSPAQAARADDLLSGASALNPDRTVDILRGEVATARGDDAGARRILLGVTRAEPKNIEAWVALAHAAGSDQALFLRAFRAVHQLEPLVPAGS